MQKHSYCIIELGLYMEDFLPLRVYEVLGIRPNECKLKHQKPCKLSYHEWRSQLESYQQANLTLSPNASTNSTESCDSDDENLGQIPPAFYKIRSKAIAPQNIRKECDHFIQRLEKKYKALWSIKEEYNAFFVLKIYACINPKETLAINLSSRSCGVCSKLGVRVVVQTSIL